jgi:molecular chaperone GrpE (heat shock protein)
VTRKRAPWEVEDPNDLITLHAWADDHGADRLAIIEGDVKQFVFELASARSQLTEQGSEQRREFERHLSSLLDVLDGFERVFDNIRTREAGVTPTMKAWIANFRTVQRLLGRVLREQGVAPIETPTREFDPRWHTAAETVESSAFPPGTIVEEIKRGYIWRKQVLRKAEVVVVRETIDSPGLSTPGSD